MSLTTSDKIRTLQRKLYLKTKAEPNYRFYLLYDKVYRADILRHAHDLARANEGAPGVDGVNFAVIEAAGLEDWLDSTRCPREAHGDSRTIRSLESWACSGYAGCILARRRQLRDETSRRA
jgi:hypothetical protein